MSTTEKNTLTHSEERQVRQEIQKRRRLIARINREFDKKFFIGDITLSDQDFEILLEAVRSVYTGYLDDCYCHVDSPLLSVILVQIGMRHYDGQYYWPHVMRLLGLPSGQRNQGILGEAFIYTLKKHGKYIPDESERVQAILFHGFVSNYYSKGLFELLFQYYSRDLERDIHRNTTEQMQLLMETLAIKANQDEKQGEQFTDQFMHKGSRAYKLKRHTLQAISAQPVPSRVRLRRLIRLMDRAFWKDSVPKNPSSRLTILFKEWMAESPTFNKEYRLYQMGEIRNRGKKHFSKPYLFAHIAAGQFELKLPAQIVPEANAADLQWEIQTETRKFRLDTDTYPALTGFKTEECRTPISQRELFGQIQCHLVHYGTVVRRFDAIPSAPVRFFDMEGDYAPRLFRIPMCAYTQGNVALSSSALLASTTFGTMTRWDFEFQQGDLVILPDGSGLIVGDSFADGFVHRGCVPEIMYSHPDGGMVSVYKETPDLLLTLPKSKRDGTILYCDGEPFKLTDCRFAEFDTRDSKGIQAMMIPTGQFVSCKENGCHSLVVDIPGNTFAKQFSFVLVSGLDVTFEGAPYVFEEVGTAVFPDHIRVDGDYDLSPEENGFLFTLDGNSPVLYVTVDDQIPLTIQIPMLSWSCDRKNWNVLSAGELWHTEFLDMKYLYLRGPFSRISLSTDADIPDDDDTEQRAVSGELGADGIFTIDLIRFRSWLTREVMRNDIFLKLGSREFTFATVYTRSLVAAFDVTADYENGLLTCLCDIVGKAEYYIDITHVESGTEIAEKLPITDGRLEIQDRLRSGMYRFVLYEAEEDESGFELEYMELATKDRKLVNRNDLSGQYLTIMKFKSTHYSNLYTEFQEEYIVRDLEKKGRNVYEGMLLINRKESDLRVEVAFPNPTDPRLFHLRFYHEEYEEFLSFIFDKTKSILVTDDDMSLRRSERYRRFRELYEDDFIYFGFLKDTLPKLDKRFLKDEASEMDMHTERMRRKTISEMGLSDRSYLALKRSNIQTAGQLADMTVERILRIRNLNHAGINEIAERMASMGLPFHKPDFSTEKPKEITDEVTIHLARPTEEDPVSMCGEEPCHGEVTHLPAAESVADPEDDIRATPVVDMGFSSGALLALLNLGISTAGDIANLTPFKLKQLSKLQMEEVKQKMQGLQLRIKLS